MSKVLGAIAAFLTAAIVGVTSAAAEVKAPRRTALVIGNADYVTSPLSNPVNDARAMARALRKLGFDVIERINVDQAGMKRAIWDYGKKLRQGGVGLFYFAGHGIQVGGENYLIPLKARIEGEPDLELEGVRVTRVLAEMEKANNGMNIVILDACRNNPFARSFRSVSRGLAHMSAPYGTLLAYATAPGSVAADGEGSNGLYTSELLTAIRTPGLRVEDVFKRVRRKVRKKSQGKQVPWESTSIEGDFYFVPAKLTPPKPVMAKQPPVINLIPPAAVSGDALEIAFWKSIKDSKYPADYNAYLRRYPEGAFAPLAKTRLKALQPKPAQVAKQAAKETPAEPVKPDTPASAPAKSKTQVAALTVGRPRVDVHEMERNFVTLNNVTVYAEPTRNASKVGRIANASAVVVTGKLRESDWYRIDRRRGPDAFVQGHEIAPVGATEIAHWERIKNSRNPRDFRLFRKKYPRSAVAPVAKAHEDRLRGRPARTQQASRRNGAQPKRQRSEAGQAFRDVWGETRTAFGSAMNFFSGKKSAPKSAREAGAGRVPRPLGARGPAVSARGDAIRRRQSGSCHGQPSERPVGPGRTLRRDVLGAPRRRAAGQGAERRLGPHRDAGRPFRLGCRAAGDGAQRVAGGGADHRQRAQDRDPLRRAGDGAAARGQEVNGSGRADDAAQAAARAGPDLGRGIRGQAARRAVQALDGAIAGRSAGSNSKDP